MSTLLEYRGVSCALGSKSVLRDFSLRVEEGETIVLLGRSGSGKTTVLRCANRLLEPSQGSIVFQNRTLVDWNPIELRRNIGYVIQESGLLPHLTVARNVGLVPRLSGWPEQRIQERVDELLESVGLPARDYGHRYPRQLSGGERQRVGIARALAADPPLLLLDEPFGALDPITRFELQKLFLGLRRQFGKTALFVTHDVREALMMASRVALLHDGRLHLLAEPDEFLRSRLPEAREFLASLENDWRPVQ